jgi:hypothetical protein
MQIEQLLPLLDEMVEHQREKVLRIAKELVPGITPEDLRNPHDFAELAANQRFNYEDGILSGYMAMRVAVLAERNKQR